MHEDKKAKLPKNDKPLHWADLYAERIIHQKGDKDLYTLASGITPSGTVHIGNFREIISVELVVRALREKGKKVRFIYSWDDFDVFRKVPKNMPNPQLLEKYLRQPIDAVPDTTGKSDSYARFNELEVEETLPVVGIYPEYIYQSKRYRSHAYAQQMRESLKYKDALKEALDQYRKEPLDENWMPISIFCQNCNKDTTQVKQWDGDWQAIYTCSFCSETYSCDLRQTSLAKLPWRLDWPMRWVYEKVDFEPAGKDHHSQGGSFDTSRLVVKVYNGEAPVTFQYDFLSIKGRGGKISSSSGEVISLQDVLKVYTPELTRYLFASTRPNAEFAISFDLDVLKIYEDYDRTQRLYYGLLEAKNAEQLAKQKRIYELSQPHHIESSMPYDISFRHLTTLAQIYEGDWERVLASLPDLKRTQHERLISRLECAYYWVKNFAPDDYRFSLRKGAHCPLEPQEEEAVNNLIIYLRNHQESLQEKELNDEIYTIARQSALEPVQFFKVIYRLLIGKQQGPRLASFLSILGSKKAIELLSK